MAGLEVGPGRGKSALINSDTSFQSPHRGYSPVSSPSILAQKDLNRVPVTLTSELRGYNPGPQPVSQVQTLPRNQPHSTGSTQDYSNQTLPSRYSQTMQQNLNRTQLMSQVRSSSGNINQQLHQKMLHQQQQKINHHTQQQPLQQQNIMTSHIQQQNLLKQQQPNLQQQQQLFRQQMLFQQQQQQVIQQQHSVQQQKAAMQQQKQQQQAVQQLLERQRSHEAEQRLQKQQKQQQLQQQQIQQQQIQQQQLKQQQLQQQQHQQQQLKQQQLQQQQHQQQQQEELLKRGCRQEEVVSSIAGLTLNNPDTQQTQADPDRTYMNVQPVAVAGRGGKILKQGEVNENFKQDTGGKKVPVIPRSQEVKHKKEPLYSTMLQLPGTDQGNKGMVVLDDCVYANYAPASLYSNYSNYSELEVLRSTDSQGSNDDEPTEGLPNLPPNLGDSPVSSSYSELRQANILGGIQPTVPVSHTAGDGSIYEPVLPPKGVPGPNSIHFKSLSNGSTDSDYFGSCVHCGLKIIGEGTGCSAMGRLYHIQCFKCAECGRQLQGLPFFAVEGSPLCEADYMNTLEKCCKCFQPILERILRATGKPYHPSCFTCVACNNSLDGIPFTVDATNQIHCIEDFHRRFAPRCSVCQEPIMPTPGEEETVRVVALDRSFHLHCYRCVDCNLLLSSEEEGRGCYPLDNTVLCRQCNTRRIQTLTSTIANH